jgi:hypothetical protein
MTCEGTAGSEVAGAVVHGAFGEREYARLIGWFGRKGAAFLAGGDAAGLKPETRNQKLETRMGKAKKNDDAGLKPAATNEKLRGARERCTVLYMLLDRYTQM